MSGKGDKPRPLSVPRDKFESSWDKIFGKKPEKQDERKRKPTPKGQQPVEKE
jgi:hypothetical protein